MLCQRNLAGGAVGEHNLQLVEHQIQILTLGVPVLYDVLGGWIQNPAKGIVIGKGRLF
jgi:hypothetical protein